MSHGGIWDEGNGGVGVGESERAVHQQRVCYVCVCVLKGGTKANCCIMSSV